MDIFRSLCLFLLSGLCEIGGGYLIWLAVREGKPYWYGILGAIVLIVYGFVPTLQENTFGRTYAGYGGFFIALSLLWGWKVDGLKPDKYDIIGVIIALIGVCIIFYGPRTKDI